MGGDAGRAVPRVVSLLWGLPVTAPTLAFSTRVEPSAACVVLPSPASWDLPLPPSVAVVLGGGGVTGWGVLPMAALGRALTMAHFELGLAVASGAERPPLGDRRG